MLSEVLSALKGLKAELQEQLAQQPEYRALLILDSATSQLGDALARADERGAPGLGGPGQAEAAAPRPSARATGRLVVVHDAAVGGGAPPAPRDAQSETPRQGSDAPEPANEPTGALPARHATIADFRIATPRDPAQDAASANASPNLVHIDDIVDATPAPTAEEIASAVSVHEPGDELPGESPPDELAAPSPAAVEDRDPPSEPVKRVAGEEIDDSHGAPSESQAISGLAALYASAREFSDATLSDDGAPTPIVADEAHAASVGAAPVLERIDSGPTPSPAGRVSRMAALYESAGDLPDEEPREDGAGGESAR